MLSLLLIWLHAFNYTKPYEQRQYVLWRSIVIPILIIAQHNSHPLHGTDILSLSMATIHLLLARDLLSSPLRMLRSICDRVFLRTHVPLSRARSTRTETILSNIDTSSMGMASQLVQEMLRRGEGYMEDT